MTGRGRGRAGLEGKVGSSVVSSLRCLQDTESEGNLSLEFREGRAGRMQLGCSQDSSWSVVTRYLVLPRTWGLRQVAPRQREPTLADPRGAELEGESGHHLQACHPRGALKAKGCGQGEWIKGPVSSESPEPGAPAMGLWGALGPQGWAGFLWKVGGHAGCISEHHKAPESLWSGSPAYSFPAAGGCGPGAHEVGVREAAGLLRPLSSVAPPADPRPSAAGPRTAQQAPALGPLGDMGGPRLLSTPCPFHSCQGLPANTSQSEALFPPLRAAPTFQARVARLSMGLLCPQNAEGLPSCL